MNEVLVRKRESLSVIFGLYCLFSFQNSSTFQIYAAMIACHRMSVVVTNLIICCPVGMLKLVNLVMPIIIFQVINLCRA